MLQRFLPVGGQLSQVAKPMAKLIQNLYEVMSSR